MNQFILDLALCTACRACELACHYHHRRACGTSMSSIHINYVPNDAQVEITFDGTCDLCTQEAAPFCVRFCAPGALRSQT